jgi:hypothetical protein
MDQVGQERATEPDARDHSPGHPQVVEALRLGRDATSPSEPLWAAVPWVRIEQLGSTRPNTPGADSN